ncbi:Putative G-protein coupled receptor Mth-like 1 [Gryllus bimaculatus]|nr:Putative G-protein coupled receptor Mth-like 1 [Gryllus bimaculatus]
MVLTREIGWRGRLAGEPSQENVYYSALFASGALFLVATLLVHALLPELRRSPHAKALMCHCAALAVAFAALAAGHVLRVAAEPFCSASVLTLLMERINACKRGQRVSAQPPSAEGQRRRFLAYSLYAWGSPALLTAATLVLQYAAPQHLPLLPHVGARRCWIDTKAAELLYYYLPVLLLLAADVALFAFTVIRIKREHHLTAPLRAGSSSHTTRGGRAPHSQGPRRRMLRVLTRLFCVMGVSWVTEVIAWTVDSQAFPFWYVTDPINFLRGLLIFVFFCWKPLHVRWRRWRRRREGRRRRRRARRAAAAGGGAAGRGGGGGRGAAAGAGRTSSASLSLVCRARS